VLFRSATIEDLEAARAGGALDEITFRRARHVVTENGRVLAAVELLRRGELTSIGPALAGSHHSLRDDYEVSCPELDAAVDAAVTGGAVGARMTGGGFGGSALALTPIDAADRVTGAVTEAFAEAGFGPPAVFAVSIAGGAERVSG
jgi:galactokinase